MILFRTIIAAGLLLFPLEAMMAQAGGDGQADERRRGGVTPAPSTLHFTINAYQLTSLSYNGRSYFQDPGQSVQGATFQSPDGATVEAGMGKPSNGVQTANPLSFQQVYNQGGPHQFTVKVVWSASDARTVKAVASVTNNDPVNTLTQLTLHLIPLNLPGKVALGIPVGALLRVNQFDGDLATVYRGAWGSVATWISGYPTPAGLLSYYNSATQTSFVNMLRSYTITGPNTYNQPIAPGQTRVYTQYVRFGGPTDTAPILAPEAYSEYRSAYPYLVNWPDRRPIAYWLISDATNGRSATNPRGYFWDKTINAANLASFQARALTQTDYTLNVLNQMSVKPQGVIVWDVEGQEFNQPFSYVGFPNFLPALAPEMDAVADQVFAKIAAAGYKVGVTIRPNNFMAGTQFPSTCYSTTKYSAPSNYALADKYIKLDAAYPYRGYYCVGGNWTAGNANQPSAQTSVTSYDQILDLVRQKIAYANKRWGATIFYFDSDVWEGGAVLDPSMLRTLAAEFPNCLIIPETAGTFHFAAGAPYEAAKAFNYYGTSAARRDLYPEAFGAINLADADWQNHWTQLVQSVASGDLILFRGWFPAPEIAAVQQIYAAAAAQKQQ